MRIDIAWWDLKDSTETVESLRAQLRDEGVQAWEEVPGLREKFWMSDVDNGRWGAVMIWESERPDVSLLPPNRAAELIGYPPTHRTRFDAEAVVSKETSCMSTWS